MLNLLLETLFVIFKIIYIIFKNIFNLFVSRTRKSVVGEIVLVTGAGSGIGKSLAIAYASLGAKVICLDINSDTNNKTLNEIKMMGKDAVYAYRCNVADREDVFKIAEIIKKEVGDVTILVNNAGIVIVKKLLNQSADEVERVININLTSHYWMLQAFLPNMIKKNYGHVVTISSLAGFFGATHGTVYCPTKSAVKVLMEAVHDELRTYFKGKSLIKFTTIYPAYVNTALIKKPKMRFPSIMRMLTPQETASLIIDAQRKNFRERSVPSRWLFLFYLLRLLPDEVIFCILDFLDIGADVDED